MATRSRNVSIMIILLILAIFQIHFSDACSHHPLKPTGKVQQTRKSFEESSKLVEAALTKTAEELKNTTNTALKRLDKAAASLRKLDENSVKELSGSIKKASNGLVKIVDKVTNSIDKGVAELGKTVREAIDASKEIPKTLACTIDEAVVEVDKQIEHATNTLRNIVSDFTESLNKTIAELRYTLRYIGDAIVQYAKSFNIIADSGDLVEVAQVTKDGLVDAVTALSTTWEVAVKTADLKDAGAAAAAELYKAMLKIKYNSFEKCGTVYDYREPLKYIGIAGGIALFGIFVLWVLWFQRGKRKNVKSTEMKKITYKMSDMKMKEVGDSNDLTDMSLENVTGDEDKNGPGFRMQKLPTPHKNREKNSQPSMAQQKESLKDYRLLDMD